MRFNFFFVNLERQTSTIIFCYLVVTILRVTYIALSVIVCDLHSSDMSRRFIQQMTQALSLVSVPVCNQWIPLLNRILDGNSCTKVSSIHTFVSFQVFNYDFITCTNFSHIEAWSTVIDDLILTDCIQVLRLHSNSMNKIRTSVNQWISDF